MLNGPRGRARPLIVTALITTMALAGCTGGQGGTAAQSTSGAAGETADPSIAPFEQIPDIVDRVKPSVVTIRTGKGLGSGVIYSSDGVIVTNQHVVARGKGAQAPVVDQVTVTFTTGQKTTGRVVGADFRTDLAVIKVDENGLRAAEFQTDLPEVGELAIAIGSPLGLTESVTAGIISGLNRSISGGKSPRPLINLIQTDAPISPGSSGGALINEDAEVVGINELYIPPEKGAVSLGFAIPSATVVDVVEQILETGEAEHAFFGVGVTAVTPYIAEQLGLQQARGLLVRQVLEGSGAAQAGIRRGDVIVAFEGDKIAALQEFQAKLREHEPGDTVSVTVVRDGDEVQVDVTLTDRPAAAS